MRGAVPVFCKLTVIVALDLPTIVLGKVILGAPNVAMGVATVTTDKTTEMRIIRQLPSEA